MISLKMFPAKNGDAFLIKAGIEKNGLILIDGGYKTTFTNFIAPALKMLNTDGYSVGLVITTHIDQDHILGLIKFIEENKDAKNPEVISVQNFWHNSLRSIPMDDWEDSKLSIYDQELMNELNYIGFSSSMDSRDEIEEIGGQQGSSLARLLTNNNYCWNFSNGSQSINIQETPIFELNEDITLRVLGPYKDRLIALKDQWLSELRRYGFAGKINATGIFDDGFEFLCARESEPLPEDYQEISSNNIYDKNLDELYKPDTAINNGSSIAVVIESENKRILFLGDAWAEDIEKSIKNLYGSSETIFFDAIKISHHGSVRNTSPSLLKLIDSNIFLISTNGKVHSHPDFCVLKAIVDRPVEFKRKIYFSYKTDVSHLLKHYQAKSSFEVYEEVNNWINIGE